MRRQVFFLWISWILIGGVDAFGQSSVYVAPPSSVLAPTTKNVLPAHSRAVLPPNDFDGYSDCDGLGAQLRFLDTIGIPFGASGTESQWGAEVLESCTLDRFRKKFVQRVELAGGWVYRDSPSSLGYSFASAGITMVVPLGSTDNLLVVTPRHRVDWLEGPNSIDLPARLNSTSFDIGWRGQWNDRFSTIVGVQPSWTSDGEADRNRFRMGGLVLLNYQLIPKRLDVMLGAVYLDRADFGWLPAAGVNWRPTPDWRFELTFPRPKLAYRVGHLPYQFEDWIYVAMSIGGGSYAVRRTGGALDELSLKDYRLVFGGERMIHGGTGFNLEAGFVFARSLEYASVGTELKFSETWVLEAGWRF